MHLSLALSTSGGLIKRSARVSYHFLDETPTKSRCRAQKPAAHNVGSQLWTARPERTQNSSRQQRLVESTALTVGQVNVHRRRGTSRRALSSQDGLQWAATRGERPRKAHRHTEAIGQQGVTTPAESFVLFALALGDANRLANPPFIFQHSPWSLGRVHPKRPLKTGH